MTNVLLRRALQRDGDTGEKAMRKEARIGVVPQVKEHLGPTEAGRHREGFLSRAFGGSVVLLTWRINFCCFKPLHWRYLVTAALGN